MRTGHAAVTVRSLHGIAMPILHLSRTGALGAARRNLRCLFLQLGHVRRMGVHRYHNGHHARRR